MMTMDICGWKGPWACYKRDSFGLRWQMMYTFIYTHVIDALGLNNHKKDLTYNQHWFHALWS